MLKSSKTGCVVAACGPSLSQLVADACHGLPAIAVSNAWNLFSWAEALYSGDAAWWEQHHGAPDFQGEKWTSHNPGIKDEPGKAEAVAAYGLQQITCHDRPGFCFEPGVIHSGANSGFQAINLAFQRGYRRIVLVGFDMRYVDGQPHFFGWHPQPLRNPKEHGFNDWTRRFDEAAASLPDDIEIRNATPGSALTCFASLPLGEAREFLRA